MEIRTIQFNPIHFVEHNISTFYQTQRLDLTYFYHCIENGFIRICLFLQALIKQQLYINVIVEISSNWLRACICT